MFIDVANELVLTVIYLFIKPIIIMFVCVSEMLLTPKRGASTATPRKRPVVKRRQPSTVDSDSDSDRPATLQSLITLTRSVTTLMLPPRDLPAVIRRRPVTTRQMSDSHSDSETSSNLQTNRKSIRPTGSTSDIVGTLI